jgi:hypothetical protein
VSSEGERWLRVMTGGDTLTLVRRRRWAFMYATVEADIKKGRIVPLEPERIPSSGHALIVLLDNPGRKASWNRVRGTLGWLDMRTDPCAWQRSIRSEWDGR